MYNYNLGNENQEPATPAANPLTKSDIDSPMTLPDMNTIEEMDSVVELSEPY